MVNAKLFLPAITCLFLSQVSVAKSLGVVGELWPVKERSMLALLKERAAKVNRAELKLHWQNRVKVRADRPEPLHLPRAEKSTRHRYEPIAHVTQDIVSADGHLIAGAGSSVNALAQLPGFKPEMLFFNADDKAQVRWAENKARQLPQAKLILTRGSIRAMELLFNRPIYFDQLGVITKKFAITHLPAHAYRRDLSIIIDELAIKENGNER